MFHTLEMSEQAPELARLQFVTVKSRAIGGRADITMFAPREAAGQTNLPLVILLHGVYGSHWNWALSGKAHRTTQRLVSEGAIPPMALAMPSDGLWGDGSAYLRHGGGADFERWIAEEVPAAAAAALGCVSDKSPLLIAGLSMGGFGALRIGAKHPERFRAMAGHSSITHFEQMKLFVEEDLGRYSAAPADQSVLETMQRNRDRLPPFRLDCGLDDPLIEHNRELHRQLERSGIAHQYQEFPGGHEWTYWATHLEDTLRFFGSVPEEK